tara:strand:- start:3000 stop:3926 length:927 start_codon:yes stop_codon:yes gene_type:complete
MIEFYSRWNNLCSEEYGKAGLHPYKVRTPEWFNKMPKWMPEDYQNNLFSFGKNKVQGVDMTLKACPAAQDLFRLGNSYMIPNWADFAWGIGQEGGNDPSMGTINEDAGEMHIQFKAADSAHWFQTDIHPEGQHYMGGRGSPTASNPPGLPSVKLISPWSFKTPPGTSTLFFHPLSYYDVDLPFEVLPGLVHTDMWHEVNFPVVWKSGDRWSGWCRAGIPMVQAIVFQRQSYDLKVYSVGEDDYWNKLNLDEFRGGFSTIYKQKRRTEVKWKKYKKHLTLIHKLLKFFGVYKLFKSKDNKYGKCPVVHE